MYLPANACTLPVTVNILFLLTLWMQQLIRAAIAVKAITTIPRTKKTNDTFQRVGKTLGSVESPSMAKIPQLLCPSNRVQRLKTPTDGGPTDIALPFSGKIAGSKSLM